MGAVDCRFIGRNTSETQALRVNGATGNTEVIEANVTVLLEDYMHDMMRMMMMMMTSNVVVK